MKETRTERAIRYAAQNTKIKHYLFIGLEKRTPVTSGGSKSDFLSDVSITFGREECRSEIVSGKTAVEAVRRALADLLAKHVGSAKRYQVILDVTNNFNEGYELSK